jgi:hypothetical protein
VGCNYHHPALAGAPASFQQLMEAITKGLPNLLIHLDDIIIHSRSHLEHLDHLWQLFQRLQGHHLKVNFPTSDIRLAELSFLGFCLTPEGISLGEDNLKALRLTTLPASVQEIPQF